MEKENKKKTAVQIIVLIFLSIILAALIYLSFFFKYDLRKMGYDNHDLYLFYKAGVLDEVKIYSPSLLYSVRSKNFKKQNSSYYVLFFGEFDYTETVNALALKYSVEEVEYLCANLGEDETLNLADTDKISVEKMKEMILRGYENTTAVSILQQIGDDDVDELLKLQMLSNPQSYVNYLSSGYSYDIIAALYEKLGEDVFDDFSLMAYHSALNLLIESDSFNIYKLPRYLIYLHTHNTNVSQTLSAVNADEDLIKADTLDYSAFYKPGDTVEQIAVTSLINKEHPLSENATAQDLVDLDGSYRGNNQPLNREAAEAFVAMADALKAQGGSNIVAYSNYLSANEVETQYNRLLLESKNNASAVDKFASKPYYSEHQSGLSCDIALQNESPTRLDNTDAYHWLINNSYLYGFVQRYPSKKEAITGYGAIVYHFRYVGKEAAAFMNRYNYTLEEYTALFEQ